MSYIENKITIEEYLNSVQDKGKKNHIGSILNQFNIFCKQKYNKSSQQIMDDLYNEVKETGVKDKIYIMFNHFKDWLLIDHPEITYVIGVKKNIERTIEAKHPNSIRTYIKVIRGIIEEIGNLEINNRILLKRVKIPKGEKDEPEPFTKEQMRLLLDRCSSKTRLKYMVMKDTGCRTSELVQMRKSDVDTSKVRISIKIQARYEKTRRASTRFITKETEPMFRRLLKHKKENELLFGSNEDKYIAKTSEKVLFSHYRKELSKDYPEFEKIYQGNGRHVKTLHSIRSFTTTQCARAIDESWGHGYTGHKKYLDQYIRDKEDYLERFLRSESHLMVYETIEVIDSDERVAKLEFEQKQTKENMITLLQVMDQIKDIKKDNENKNKQIKELQMILKSK
ncbi:MAG: tyrosine-type recombinase/integrase [Nitrosopumilus sp.]|jgi:integrase|nr:tyrosine-type recombinase/integrase [Nitrosopumilus sp.]MBT4327812.1 tyrosine-type recombinase/integrase [Candidatus Nitrosopelagicus sp.]